MPAALTHGRFAIRPFTLPNSRSIHECRKDPPSAGPPRNLEIGTHGAVFNDLMGTSTPQKFNTFNIFNTFNTVDVLLPYSEPGRQGAR